MKKNQKPWKEEKEKEPIKEGKEELKVIKEYIHKFLEEPDCRICNWKYSK